MFEVANMDVKYGAQCSLPYEIKIRPKTMVRLAPPEQQLKLRLKPKLFSFKAARERGHRVNCTFAGNTCQVL